MPMDQLLGGGVNQIRPSVLTYNTHDTLRGTLNITTRETEVAEK